MWVHTTEEVGALVHHMLATWVTLLIGVATVPTGPPYEGTLSIPFCCKSRWSMVCRDALTRRCQEASRKLLWCTRGPCSVWPILDFESLRKVRIKQMSPYRFSSGMVGQAGSQLGGQGRGFVFLLWQLLTGYS
jgi:hypothetical protein